MTPCSNCDTKTTTTPFSAAQGIEKEIHRPARHDSSLTFIDDPLARRRMKKTVAKLFLLYRRSYHNSLSIFFLGQHTHTQPLCCPSISCLLCLTTQVNETEREDLQDDGEDEQKEVAFWFGRRHRRHGRNRSRRRLELEHKGSLGAWNDTLDQDVVDLARLGQPFGRRLVVAIKSAHSDEFERAATTRVHGHGHRNFRAGTGGRLDAHTRSGHLVPYARRCRTDRVRGYQIGSTNIACRSLPSTYAQCLRRSLLPLFPRSSIPVQWLSHRRTNHCRAE
jgi:hypothetical protein